MQQPPPDSSSSSDSPSAEKWFIEPPSTFEGMASQASRSLLGALGANRRRLIVETAAPELDPSMNGKGYKPQELVAFAHDVAQPLLQRGGLPKSKPHTKLLFSSMAEATLAGGTILTTDLPVSMLGHPSAIGPRDGAFIVVAPNAATADVDAERALSDLVQQAGSRLVVLVNPRLGNAPLLSTFEPCYLMRPLSVGFLRDQMAQSVERVPVCLLRCYPHEWQVLFVPPTADKAGRTRGAAAEWRYAGRFARQPSAEEIERLLKEQMTRARDEGVPREGSGS